MGKARDRAVIFTDGNNWYHSLREAGIENRGQLDYRKVSEKLIGPREWIATRYYIGRVDQRQGQAVYRDQRTFVSSLQATDHRISVHFGRIEPRPAKNKLAVELRQYLSGLTVKVDPRVYRELFDLAKQHDEAVAWIEKAVDVNLAVDMVAMACRGELDAAYILSADGDFTSAAHFVRSLSKRVYAASPGHGAQLATAVDSFISLKPEWFADCYR